MDGPPLTQDHGKSKVKYAWVILFHYCVNESHPFSMVPLSSFVGSDFPWEGVEGLLSPNFRNEKRTFSNIPGKTFTIFAKVEVGELLIYIIVHEMFRDSQSFIIIFQVQAQDAGKVLSRD